MAALRMRSFLFFLSSPLIIFHIGSTVNAASELVFDSIYQFGDSISDTGNMKRLSSSSASCNHSPYGQTFFKKPTGRCSDGLLMVDFFARAMELPLLNPYLQKDANFSHGVNFAVAGATALNSSVISSKVSISSPFPTSDNSLSVQLGWFRTHLESACPSSSDCKQMFQKTLFLVGEVGGNDYNFPLMFGKSIQDVKQLVPDVVQSISNAVKEVIAHGAVQVVVPGNFPIGCLPVYLNSFGSNNSTMYDDLGCLKSLNEFAAFHNDQLQQAIKELQKQNPNVTIYYGDYYTSFRWILQNADSLGFEKDAVFKPCCGDMNNHFCGNEGTPVCSDPKKRMSWDGIHLTQEMYRNLAQWLMSKTFSQAIPCCADSEPSASGADVVSVVLLRVVVVSVLALWTTGSKLF